MIPIVALTLAVAAPVPKPAEKKLEEVYGKVADPKGDCKFEMGKGGVLTVTVPTTHPPLKPGFDSTRPLVGKAVEGDFVVTVRVKTSVPKAAGDAGQAGKPTVFAGVIITSADDPEVIAMAGVVHRRVGDDWKGGWYECRRLKAAGNGATEYQDKTADAVVFARMTRTGEQLLTEMSDDGTAWSPIAKSTRSDMTGKVTVGPVAFRSIDQEFSATFDQYEIKLLKEERK